MLISENRLEKIFKSLNGKTVAIIGDLMLDRYVWGNVMRISPEAPVPIVEVEDESVRLGGAANVSNNINSLGGIPFLLGVVGDDLNGNILKEISTKQGFDTSGIIVDDERPTTVKTRVIAHNQHVVRIDNESRKEISKSTQSKILGILNSNISRIDAIIFQDYNKGVIVKDLIYNVISLAKSCNKIITVDPKYNNFFEYKNVFVFKPNRKETEEALGIKLDDEQTLEYAGKKLLEMLHPDNVLITRGEYGMSIFSKSNDVRHIPTTARKVADVSGAGDTVISTLTMAITAGADIYEAAVLANTAGGIVCGEVGIVPIDREELYQTLLEDMNHRQPRKPSA
ncbi:MAG: D-glycero-beta-D-manno-heptose-7-phosphate kinase [Bacteroidota bacterium]|nr:D-glycero-beta-D-manno-heptose-7-phosphate kinase [Bacteroidota bacterium]MBU1421938.1 D-glycero-beta-D-manno-heptose-7-phosphate kinase [Bacteroidota bacterium]MDI6778922.1 D-glycero-beta-D-manno-heptose-7-phosphate kinase [Bacteroidota bacterium]